MRLPPAFLARPLAHRGLHDAADGRPENSRAAIAAAIARGYGLEIDVQGSADGRAMVFHDEALDRLTDRRGRLRDHDADALGAIALRGGAETIPTLREILSLVAGRVPVLVEIKDQSGVMGAGDGRLERAVAADLAAGSGPVAVMSFNPRSVATLARLAPDIPRGLTTAAFAPDDWPLPRPVLDRLREIPDFDAVGAGFVSHEAADLDRRRLGELRGAGAAILCWTIRSPEAEARARERADNITFEGYLPAKPG